MGVMHFSMFSLSGKSAYSRLPQKIESTIWIVGKSRKIDLGFGNLTSRVVIALLKATVQETPGALVVACTESRRSTSGERNHLEWNVLGLSGNFQGIC